MRRGRAIALFAAAALAALAALAGIGALTRARIAAQAHADDLAALGAVLPPTAYDNDPIADRVLVVDPNAFGADTPMPILRARRHGAPGALVLQALAPHGYAGPIRLIVGVDVDGSVLGVRVLEHHETPGFGDAIEAQRSDWIERLRGRSLSRPTAAHWAVRKDGGDFDQIGGATVTSRALIEAVKRVLEYVATHRDAVFAAPAGSVLRD